MEVITLDEEEEKKTPIDFNVFAGAETGLLKGVSINTKMNISKNFSNMHALNRKHEITAMSWGNEDQTELLLGLRGQIVRTFDTQDKAFTSSHEISNVSGKIVGVVRAQDALVVATECGTIQVLSAEKKNMNVIDYDLSCSGKLKANSFKDEEAREKHLVSLKVDRSLCKMRGIPGNSCHIATAGKENHLQLWDVNQIDKEPIFRAKNVPSDSLELRVPIWITDFCFPFQDSGDKIATVTRYGHVRLYDPKGSQRRPVLSMDWPEETLSAVSSTSLEHEIIVGTTTGHVAQFDLRMSHKGMRRKYRGCTGGIRSIDCHPKHSCFAVVGLDRFLRIFDINKPKSIQKMYLKSKLNQVLISKDFDPTKAIAPTKEVKKTKKKAPVSDLKSDAKVKEEGDEFWAKLQVIRGTTKKGKRSKTVENTVQTVNIKKAKRVDQ